MRVDYSRYLDVFCLLAFRSTEGLLDLNLANQKTKDALTPQKLDANGQPRMMSWAGVAATLRGSSRKQDITRDNPIVRGVLDMMKTYSLLRGESNSVGLVRGDILPGDMMIRPPDTLDTPHGPYFIPAFHLRNIKESSLPPDDFSSSVVLGEKEVKKEEKWKIISPAVVKSPSAGGNVSCGAWALEGVLVNQLY
jgi:hypothetical protein